MKQQNNKQKNNKDSKSIILNYGLYLAIVGILSHLILYATGNLLKLAWITGITGFAAMILFIVFGIKKYKNNNDGYLTFENALKVGVGIAVFSAFISVIYTLLFTNVIDPTFQEQAMEYQRQVYLDSGKMSEDQIDASIEIAKKFQSPLITSAISIVVSAFFGFIIAAIAGAIMKNTNENELEHIGS